MVYIAIDCDDIHPEEGFGLNKDKDQLSYFKRLYDNYGAKTTIFIVPFFEEKYNITHYKDWCEWLKQQEYLEIANHGYTHSNKDERYGSQEFIDKSPNESIDLIQKSIELFDSVGIKCDGFRFPGWGLQKYHYLIISKYFKYMGDHFIGQTPIITKEGLYRIPYTLSIDNLHSTHYTNNDIVIIHSHINQKSGNNGINERLYDDLCKWIEIIKKNNDVKFIFMKELINNAFSI